VRISFFFYLKYMSLINEKFNSAKGEKVL
jgi:hypothetical protein